MLHFNMFSALSRVSPAFWFRLLMSSPAFRKIACAFSIFSAVSKITDAAFLKFDF
jgi:hypothetical protein